MIKSTIVKTDIKKAQHWNSTAFIEENILLTDRIADAVIPTEPRMMSFILVALCTKGTISYQMDHEEQKVQAGDLLIVFDRRIIDHYQASSDVEGLGIILSTEFFQETVLNVNNIRDMASDEGIRRTIPLRIGERRAKWYQTFLVVIGAGCFYVTPLGVLLWGLPIPLFIFHLAGVWKRHGKDLDPMLPLLVFSTFLQALFYGGWLQ